MKKIAKRKLVLSSTTVRHLGSGDLVQVIGGLTLRTCTELCTDPCTDSCRNCTAFC
jgi:hypothetical protein